MKLRFILLTSILLMLSSCVVPDKYGASRSIAGDSELNAMAEEYWDRYLCEIGESSFLKFDDHFYQIAGAKPIGILADTTPADNLNWIDATGFLTVSMVALKEYSAGKWSDWSNSEMFEAVPIYKKKGEWEIEDEPRLQPKDCNSIPS